MDRDQRRDRAAVDGGHYDTPRAEEQASSTQRFTSSGALPPVASDFGDGGVTASDQAYGGAGIATLKKLYTLENPEPKRIAEVVLKFPNERDAMLAWIRSAVGEPAVVAVKLAIAQLEAEAKKPHREGFGVHLHDLAPRVTPAPIPKTGTDDRYDDHQKRFEAEQKRDEERALQTPSDTHKDKAYDPMGEAMRQRTEGAPPKTKEQEKTEDKLTGSIEEAKKRAEIKKRIP